MQWQLLENHQGSEGESTDGRIEASRSGGHRRARVRGTASAAPIKEIIVPAGATYKKVIQDGETFENELIDITAPGASVRLIARGKGGWRSATSALEDRARPPIGT